MAEVELSPTQLLDLVARAFGGPGISVGKTTVDIPRNARSVFLKSYKTWSSRETDPDAGLPLRIDRNQIPTPYFTAASRSGPIPTETYEDPPPSDSTTGEPSSLSIPPNAPLESLTLSELRTYLADIERRVSLSKPHIEQAAARPYFYPEYVEQPETSGPQNAQQAKPTVAPKAPESQPKPFPSPLFVVHAAKAEPAPTPASDTASDTARLQPLHTIKLVAALFIIVGFVSAALVAYHYLKPQPPTFADTIHRLPPHLGERPSEPPQPVQDSTALTSDTANDIHPNQTSLKPSAAKPLSTTNTPVASASKPQQDQSDDDPEQATTTTPTPASTAQPDPQPVSVPAATMMTYALSAPSPVYPSSTRRYGVDSTVAVETTISEQGEVISTKALSGTPSVRAAALEAVQSWRFKPFLHKGNPVPVVTIFKFLFASQ